MQLNQQDKKKFRTIGHGLNPIVTIAGKGLSEAVLAELERALDDHELIKVKLSVGREQKPALIEAIQSSCKAAVVQTIGNVVLLYRPAATPNPRLSNVLRHSG